jgi:heat shock protein HslJ
MKSAFFIMMALAILAVLLAGCTSQQPASAVTSVTTPVATAVPAASAPAVPENLAGTWQLTTMGIQDGTAVTHPTTAITLYFGSDGTVSGNGGCNNYNGPYVLSGEITSKGTAITIGPLTSTKMYCQTTSAQETQYLSLLADTMAYDVDGTQLTLTGKEQNVLIYQRPSTIPTVTEGMLPA